METLTFAGFPPELAQVHLLFIENLSEPEKLRSQLIAASKLPNDEAGKIARMQLDYCFLDAARILSTEHLVTAIQGALHNAKNGCLKTPTIHSEIIYFLTPSPNVAEGIKFFGVGPTTHRLLVAKAGPQHTKDSQDARRKLESSIRELVSGDFRPLVLTPSAPEKADIYKHYRLDLESSYNVLSDKQLANIVSSMCALKATGI